MPFYRIGAETAPSATIDTVVSSKLLCTEQERLPLDQEVTQLFEQLRHSIYRYLAFVTGDPAEAQDISQEAFIQLYRCLRDGKRIENVRHWIFRVAHNLAINRGATRKNVFTVDCKSWETLCDVLPDSRPNPEQAVLQQENLKRLHLALTRLSVLQRQCLILRAEGFRYRQIAEVLQISVPNVAQSLRRGIRKIMEESNE